MSFNKVLQIAIKNQSKTQWISAITVWEPSWSDTCTNTQLIIGRSYAHAMSPKLLLFFSCCLDIRQYDMRGFVLKERMWFSVSICSQFTVPYVCQFLHIVYLQETPIMLLSLHLCANKDLSMFWAPNTFLFVHNHTICRSSVCVWYNRCILYSCIMYTYTLHTYIPQGYSIWMDGWSTIRVNQPI